MPITPEGQPLDEKARRQQELIGDLDHLNEIDDDINRPARVEVVSSDENKQELINDLDHLDEEEFLADPKAVESERVRVERSAATRIAFDLVESGQIEDSNIVAALTERLGGQSETWEKVVSFFEKGQELMPAENFSDDRRREVLSSLADVVALDHLSPEGAALLINRIVSGESDEGEPSAQHGYERTADYQAGDGEIRQMSVREKLFETGPDGNFLYDVEGIIKHEVGHGLVEHGGVFSRTERQNIKSKIEGLEVELSAAAAEVYAILESAKEENSSLIGTQSELVNAVFATLRRLEKQGESDELYQRSKAENPGLSFEAYLNMRRMQAADEIMADKVGVYVGCEGNLNDFIRLSLERSRSSIFEHLGISGPEDQNTFRSEVNKMTNASEVEKNDILAGMKEKWPGLIDYIDRNKIFFEHIDERMKSQTPSIEERIQQSTESYQKEEWDDLDSIGYPPTPRENANRGENAENSGMISSAFALCDAFGSGVEKSLPIAELKGK